MKRRVAIEINGKVQGVTYRYSTKKFAQKNNINGWVTNKNDGSVEILAEGEEKKLNELINWCHNGPDFAQVENINTNWKKYIGDLKGFVILY